MKSLHIFITTEPAPDDHRTWTKWGLRLIQSFRHQWQIESGFAGLEKAKPASHAKAIRPNYCSERWEYSGPIVGKSREHYFGN